MTMVRWRNAWSRAASGRGMPDAHGSRSPDFCPKGVGPAPIGDHRSVEWRPAGEPTRAARGREGRMVFIDGNRDDDLVRELKAAQKRPHRGLRATQNRPP